MENQGGDAGFDPGLPWPDTPFDMASINAPVSYTGIAHHAGIPLHDTALHPQAPSFIPGGNRVFQDPSMHAESLNNIRNHFQQGLAQRDQEIRALSIQAEKSKENCENVEYNTIITWYSNLRIMLNFLLCEQEDIARKWDEYTRKPEETSVKVQDVTSAIKDCLGDLKAIPPGVNARNAAGLKDIVESHLSFLLSDKWTWDQLPVDTMENFHLALRQLSLALSAAAGN